jgi:hypothetical protein
MASGNRYLNGETIIGMVYMFQSCNYVMSVAVGVITHLWFFFLTVAY